MRGRLIIVCGLPGSGKTTHAKRLEEMHNAMRFCPDEWMQVLGISLWDEAMRERIEALNWQLAQRLLSLGVTAIIEWGTWGRSERDALRRGARALGAAVELHYLPICADLMLHRMRTRGGEDKAVTEDQVSAWCRIFQAPTEEEANLFDQFVVLDTSVT